MRKNLILPKVLFLSVLIAFGIQSSYSQLPPSENQYQHNGIISILPLYLTVNGLRVDFDKAVTNNHWIQAGPIVFLSESNSNDFAFSSDDYLRHTGAGLHLYHRYYPAQGFGYTPVFISYGGMWHYNHISYQDAMGSGQDYYTSINKIGADIQIGLYRIVSERLLLEAYTGLGIRQSFFKSNGTEERNYNFGYVSPGYSGNVFTAGIRIGFITRSRKLN